MVTRPRARAVAELVLAAVAALGCAATWSHTRVTMLVAPIIGGEPETTSVNYDPQLLLLTLLLATAAGVLAVAGTARICRSRRRA